MNERTGTATTAMVPTRASRSERAASPITNPTTRLRWAVAAGTALLALAGCVEGGGLFGELDPGFTPCGEFPVGEARSCGPGEHCADPQFSECEPGCADNANCVMPASCVKPGLASIGSCREAGAVDATQRCLDACDKLVVCGALTGDEGNQCNNDCQQALSEGEQLSLAACVEPWSCTERLDACLGLECGPAFACPGGQTCLSGRCA